MFLRTLHDDYSYSKSFHFKSGNRYRYKGSMNVIKLSITPMREKEHKRKLHALEKEV